MAGNKPLVSVIIPVYNGELFLAQALGSIFGQDYRPIEVIVVDDGSSDRSSEIARSFGEVRYIFQENQGVAAARNAGISAASGEFISFLDHDDIWTQDKLRVQVSYLLENPDLGYVLSKIHNFLEPGARPPLRPTKDIAAGDTLRLSLGAIVSRRWVFEKVGGFNTSYSRAEDLDWFLRVREAGINMEVIPKVLYKRRIHESNLSFGRDSMASESLRVVKSSLDRKRKRTIVK